MNASKEPGFEPALKALRQARARLFVCFLTLPVYGYAVTQVLQSGRDTNALMFTYMGLYAVFGIALAAKRCPQCEQQFFVKRFFLNPFRRSCAHCRLSLSA
ncbi:MAG: hypothetical protein R3332_06290 [Pseudohongiellaceae bacterium]|nr:hypothetical protein [Pseudohongiellaceae bacterium]